MRERKTNIRGEPSWNIKPEKESGNKKTKEVIDFNYFIFTFVSEK